MSDALSLFVRLPLLDAEDVVRSPQVLLLFPRADAQCVALERAADVGRYEVDVARSSDAALQSYAARQHDVVVVDTRQDSSVDAETFARSAASLSSRFASYSATYLYQFGIFAQKVKTGKLVKFWNLI